MKFRYSILLLVFLLSSCSTSSLLEEALSLSGNNREELEKVFYHYENINPDTEKLYAAKFLVSNMVGWHSRIGKRIDKFNEVTDSLFKLPVTLSAKEFASILDSVLSITELDAMEYISDLKNICSGYLINAIDKAFETRSYLWSDSLDIETFCEYVLPYRIGTEALEDWRLLYTEQFAAKIDSLNHFGITDSIVAKYLMEYYTGQVAYELKSFRPELQPTVFLNIKTGDCVDYSCFTIFLCRAFGLPASYDYVPSWGNGSGRHQWGVLIRPNKKNIAFNVTDHVSFGEHVANFTKIPPKIYRHTTSIQKESLPFQNLKESIPPFFKNLYHKDVSDEYFETVDITVELASTLPEKKKIAYIMVFDNQNWQSVDWAEVKGGKAIFRKMSPLCTYIVMYYHNGSYYPASYPFHIDELGSLVTLKPGMENMDNVVLKRKYADNRVKMFCKKMAGGKFQVANNPDFSDSLTIYRIDSIPEANFNTQPVSLSDKYRYFRYLSPAFSSCNVAEIELYNESGNLIKGEILGTEGSYGEGGMDKSKVFDGDVLTFFDAPIFTNAWVGLKFNAPQAISQIVYLPRNDDNFIRDGEQYELFYWDNRWKSLGQQIGNSETQELVYDGVPKNSLLLLRNLSKGVEERIFTYESGRQVWW